MISEPIAGIFKYIAPVVIAFVGYGWYITNKQEALILVIIVLGGLAYWIFKFLPLKRVLLDGNYLIVSNDFKKDRIHLNDIDDLKTGGWSMYVTQVHFKRQTAFGTEIKFATIQKGFGIGISDRVQNILTQIKNYTDLKN